MDVRGSLRLFKTPVDPRDVVRKMDLVTGESINYSLDPQDTGVKWIDGQSVWRRVFITGSGSAVNTTNAVVDIPAGWGFHGLARLDGYLTTSDQIRTPLQYYGGPSDYLGCRIDEDGVITERHGGATMNGRPMVFIIDYISFPIGMSSWDGGSSAWDNGTTTWDQ